MESNITIRAFSEYDIEKKIRWINNPLNNKYLHYELPLELEKTKQWFKNNKGRNDRFDAVIEYNGKSVGLIGLINIINKRAEYYVTMGEDEFKGKGIARKATELLLEYAFNERNLDEVYLYTEVDNLIAQRLFEKCGFIQRGVYKNSAQNKGRWVDRFYYTITIFEYKNLWRKN